MANFLENGGLSGAAHADEGDCIASTLAREQFLLGSTLWSVGLLGKVEDSGEIWWDMEGLWLSGWLGRDGKATSHFGSGGGGGG